MMYSQLLQSPPFLFIGINPGDEMKNDPKPKIDLTPGEGFEYTNAEGSDWDYRLAKQTRDLFQQAGLYDCLHKSVKTNVYYFATSREPGLWQLFSLLGEDANRQLHEYAFDWTRRMIEMIRPKAIICEGIRAFSKLSEIYRVSKKREGSYGYLELPDKTPVVGYSRRYSDIKDKPQVAEFLRKTVP